VLTLGFRSWKLCQHCWGFSSGRGHEEQSHGPGCGAVFSFGDRSSQNESWTRSMKTLSFDLKLCHSSLVLLINSVHLSEPQFPCP
jgi:hypothetical protein